MCPFGVMVLGIGEAAAISLNNEKMYERMMNMDTKYYKHRDVLQPVFEDKTLISEFQEIVSLPDTWLNIFFNFLFQQANFFVV